MSYQDYLDIYNLEDTKRAFIEYLIDELHFSKIAASSESQLYYN